MIHEIPEGLKCFEVVEIIDFSKGEALINPCKYWVESENETYKCLFLNIECKHGDENFKIWNKDKECNVGLYDHYKPPEFYFKNIKK